MGLIEEADRGGGLGDARSLAQQDLSCVDAPVGEPCVRRQPGLAAEGADQAGAAQSGDARQRREVDLVREMRVEIVAGAADRPRLAADWAGASAKIGVLHEKEPVRPDELLVAPQCAVAAFEPAMRRDEELRRLRVAHDRLAEEGCGARCPTGQVFDEIAKQCCRGIGHAIGEALADRGAVMRFAGIDEAEFAPPPRAASRHAANSPRSRL